MKTKLVFITGAPGVGKTETGQKLIHFCPNNSALIDTDKLGSIQPFKIDDDFYELVGKNLKACINNFHDHKYQLLIITGVLIPEGMYKHIIDFVSDKTKFEYKIYGLQANEETIINRINNDNKGQNPIQRKKWLHVNDEILHIEKIQIIDTTNFSIGEVVYAIRLLEML
ncbi:AAA family ATPase [Bacillus sp. FSL K6-0268]|uniref:AAA family ATPase n=1 Tax=Bacillus sp. FSL K6-0268 TaxID=2921449 RepID=UPI0030F862E4